MMVFSGELLRGVRDGDTIEDGAASVFVGDKSPLVSGVETDLLKLQCIKISI
jgi:hypothetical protein